MDTHHQAGTTGFGAWEITDGSHRKEAPTIDKRLRIHLLPWTGSGRRELEEVGVCLHHFMRFDTGLGVFEQANQQLPGASHFLQAPYDC
jgi:hypothetical protein